MQTPDRTQNKPAPTRQLQHFFVATFAVKQTDGKVLTRVVEVPHTSNPAQDSAAAWSAVRAEFPRVPRDNIRRTSGKLESRASLEPPIIEIRPGDTIRQLFPDKTEFEAARKIGTVIFDGERRDVTLRHVRAKSMWSLTLVQSGGPAINFSEQVTVMRLSSELPAIIKNMLGDAATELKLFLRVEESANK